MSSASKIKVLSVVKITATVYLTVMALKKAEEVFVPKMKELIKAAS